MFNIKIIKKENFQFLIKLLIAKLENKTQSKIR